ncbi:TRIM4 ligase, partial [Columbina picui]|nr:TRIM4 ligase [Columbina picui]
AEVIELAKRLSAGTAPGGDARCGEHWEVLKLFCEDDRTPICLVCRETPRHRTHLVVPIEEAAEEHKEKLQAHIQTLKERREKLLALKAAEERKGR